MRSVRHWVIPVYKTNINLLMTKNKISKTDKGITEEFICLTQNPSSKSSDFFGWKFGTVLGELDADWVIEIELQSGQTCVLREN